jgi:hypothetical protein
MVLGMLHKKHDQTSRYCGCGVDNQLPGVAEAKHGSRECPEHDDNQSNAKSPRGAHGVR